MMDVEITDKGKSVKKFADLKTRVFKSGKQGFFAGGTVVIDGVAYRANILLYKV